MGNPISPRLAAVSELILTVSTPGPTISTLCSFVEKNPRESVLANLKDVQHFACEAPNGQNLSSS
jgi:hypothetical protein